MPDKDDLGKVQPTYSKAPWIFGDCILVACTIWLLVWAAMIPAPTPSLTGAEFWAGYRPLLGLLISAVVGAVVAAIIGKATGFLPLIVRYLILGAAVVGIAGLVWRVPTTAALARIYQDAADKTTAAEKKAADALEAKKRSERDAQATLDNAIATGDQQQKEAAQKTREALDKLKQKNDADLDALTKKFAEDRKKAEEAFKKEMADQVAAGKLSQEEADKRAAAREKELQDKFDELQKQLEQRLSGSPGPGTQGQDDSGLNLNGATKTALIAAAVLFGGPELGVAAAAILGIDGGSETTKGSVLQAFQASMAGGQFEPQKFTQTLLEQIGKPGGIPVAQTQDLQKYLNDVLSKLPAGTNPAARKMIEDLSARLQSMQGAFAGQDALLKDLVNSVGMEAISVLVERAGKLATASDVEIDSISIDLRNNLMPIYHDPAKVKAAIRAYAEKKLALDAAKLQRIEAALNNP